MDKMILGEDAIYSMDSRKTGLNNNVIVCGTSGCGKTMSVSEPLLLETFDKSLIATVTKRRLVQKYRSVFRDRGYVVQDLNFIQPERSSICFDPMDYIRSTQDVTFLAEAIVYSDHDINSGGDPFWDHAAISLLSAEIAYVWETSKCIDPFDRSINGITSGKPSFLDVLRMHDGMEIRDNNRGDGVDTSLDLNFRRADFLTELGEADYHFALSCWNSFKELPSGTARCVYGTLNTVLDTIFTPQMRKMFRAGKHVNFEDLANRKTILFVSSSAVNPAAHCFVNFFYAQAFKELFEYAERLPGGRLKIPVHMLCDDFATGCRIQKFPEYISVFREKQISVTLLIQSESQLTGMYGSADATTIINNCDTYLYMGGMDLQTGRSISIRLNAPLDEVLCLPVGREIIFRRGQYPVETVRYDIMRDPRYQKITRAYEQEIGA